MVTEDNNETDCMNPCDPEVNCEFCAAYWERMVAEGYWDLSLHKWTDKGWKEITK